MFKSKYLLYSLFLLLYLWVVSFLFFAFSLRNEPEDKDSRTDVIVAFTGGIGRVHEAVKLLEEEKSDLLFISGVNKKSQMGRILPAGTDLELYNKIILGKSASNTFENAKETADFIEEQDFKSIRLVTSSYHMPRGILELKIFLPENVEIIPNPVINEGFKYEEWWRWPGTMSLIVSEHAKYMAVLIRHFFYELFGFDYKNIKLKKEGS